jgi:cold shock protein
MATGTVKWFNDTKGFGFIKPDSEGADVFAHFSAIGMGGFKTITEGDQVSYDVTEGPKGQLAANIVVLVRATPAADAGEGAYPANRRTAPAPRTRDGRESRVRTPQFNANQLQHGNYN